MEQLLATFKGKHLPYPSVLQTPQCHFILSCTDLANAYHGSASGHWLEGHD